MPGERSSAFHFESLSREFCMMRTRGTRLPKNLIRLCRRWCSWLPLLALATFPTFVNGQGRVTKTARPEWPSTARLGDFSIHADFPLRRYDRLIRELPTLRSDIVENLNLEDEHESIDIYPFSSARGYRAYMARYFPEISPRRAMFVKANSPGNVFAYISSELDVDLRHESTHATLHSVLPMVPLWLDEGLAEYFEVGNSARVFGHSHLQALRRNGLRQNAPSLARLERLAKLEQMGPSEYREAWAWVHFMLHGSPIARSELRQFLHDIQAPPGKLSSRLASQVPNLDAEFVAHFRHWVP